jgi:hypothetical protein
MVIIYFCEINQKVIFYLHDQRDISKTGQNLLL